MVKAAQAAVTFASAEQAERISQHIRAALGYPPSYTGEKGKPNLYTQALRALDAALPCTHPLALMPLSPAVAPLDEQQAEAADAATAMVVISNAAPLASPPPKELSSMSTQTEIEVPVDAALQVAELEAKLEEHSNQLASLQRDREAANSAHSAALNNDVRAKGCDST